MKTRKQRKGGKFGSVNVNKSCDNNKKDWKANWSKKEEYKLYDSSFLYPGSFNLGRKPEKNKLLDENGNKRTCLELNKSCDENKRDWFLYWKDNGFSEYNGDYLYPADKNIQPTINTMIQQQNCKGSSTTQVQENFLSEVVSLIVSHNTRIQCFLDGLQQNNSDYKIRFMNCVILKLEITPTRVSVTMIDEGSLATNELDKASAKKPYFVKEYTQPTPPKDQFLTINQIKDPTTVSVLPIIKQLPNYVEYRNTEYPLSQVRHLLKIPEVNKKYTFYLVRHGQAEHNLHYNVAGVEISQTLGLKSNTSITEVARGQAMIAGAKLYKYIKDNNLRFPKHFFVSDLIRTHQTLFEMYSSILGTHKDAIKPEGIHKPIVLPCVNELAVKGTLGKCDQATTDAKLYKKIARENYPDCNIKDPNADCTSKVDWNTLYLPFYGNKLRGADDSITGMVTKQFQSTEKFHCRDTTMIGMAIFYLNKYPNLTNYIETNKNITPVIQEPTRNTLEEESALSRKFMGEHIHADPTSMIARYNPPLIYVGGKTRKYRSNRTRKN